MSKKKLQKQVTIKMDEKLLNRIKAMAERKNVGYTTLIKIVVVEYLEKEER